MANRLVINKEIINDLKDVQAHVDAIVGPDRHLLDPTVHPAADALQLYVETWVKNLLDRAIDGIEGRRYYNRRGSWPK